MSGWNRRPSSVALLGHFRFIAAGGFADNYYNPTSAPADKGIVSAGAFLFARLRLGRYCRPPRLWNRARAHHGFQIEQPDNWLRRPDPWEVVRAGKIYPVPLNASFELKGSAIRVTPNLCSLIFASSSSSQCA